MAGTKTADLNSTASGPGSRDARRLASIDFGKRGAGTKEVDRYCAEARKIMRDLAEEFSASADQIEAALTRTFEGNFMDRAMAKRTARRTVRRLREAALHANAAANNIGRTYVDYHTMWAQLINPDGRGWRFRPTSR